MVTRKIRMQGGALGITIPKGYLAEMGVKGGDEVYLVQPFSDLVVIGRLDGVPLARGRTAGRAFIGAINDRVCTDLRELWSAISAPPGEKCRGCGQYDAEWVFMRVGCCGPCVRELAGAMAFRRRVPEAELNLQEV